MQNLVKKQKTNTNKSAFKCDKLVPSLIEMLLFLNKISIRDIILNKNKKSSIIKIDKSPK